jgi:undecaprenyl-diphosphatase
MLLYHIIILAIVQGLTEFLPISSSGHLALTHHFFGGGVNAQTLLFDIAVHVGTLFAVLLYFRHDVVSMISGVFKGIKDPSNDGLHLALKIIVASLPVIIAGYILMANMPNWVGSIEVIGWMTLLFGIVLWLADKYGPRGKTIEILSYKNAFLIGFAQILALIPGVSRSGITMTAGRMVGLEPSQAARFSLFLAMVAISGAGALTGLDLIEAQDLALSLDILTAVFFSFISGYLAIHLMLKWLEKHGFGVFVVYRIILGAALLILF